MIAGEGKRWGKAALGAAVALMLLLALPGLLRAADEDAAARQFVAEVAKRVVDTIHAGKLSETQRLKRYAGIFDQSLDISEIARTALGRHWNALTASERRDYLRLFRGHIIRIYARRFGGQEGASLALDSAVETSAADTLVTGRIERPGAKALETVFRVRRAEDGWRIVDVAVDGVSLALTKRSEFGSLVTKSGIGGLLAALREEEPKPVGAAEIFRSL